MCRVVLLSLCALLAACTAPSAPRAPTDDAAIVRDVDELQRIERVPRSCDVDSACPAGSHCADERCAWECIGDSDCGAGTLCTARGTCAEGERARPPFLRSANDSTGCQAITLAERMAALEELNAEQRFCADDEGCPCGSYCASNAACRVDCTADDLTSCQPGQICSPLGRCADGPADPGPQIEVNVELAPGQLTANTASGPVVVEAEITLHATSLEVLEPQHPATVFVGFAERRDPGQPLLPRVKCAAAGELAADCELSGGWLFDVAARGLRSAPRKVWIEIPQVAAERSWTLEARSEWADLPSSTIVVAEPVLVPPTDSGRYTGTLRWPQPGGEDLLVAVEAEVSETHVAVFEPTQVLLPMGRVLLSREAGKITKVEWVRSEVVTNPPSRLDVAFALGTLGYDATSGRLDAVVSLYTRSGVEPLGLELRRTGGLSGPLPPNPPDAIIVPSVGLHPAATGGVISGQLQAWAGPLKTVTDANPALLGGSGITGMERAYCFRTPSQPAPGRLGYATVEPSLDLGCMDGEAQSTFAYVNRTREVEVSAQGAETFHLLDRCIDDLGAQPTGPATAANLLPPDRPCASLGRFFLALGASAAQPPQEAGQRILSQLLRQWLSVNSFAARTTVQEQGYDDVLGTGGPAAHERFGDAVDVMERAWRVLLDPAVRGQYLGADAETVAAPDYRFVTRPIARWSFSSWLPGVAIDSERGITLPMSGAFSNPDQKQVLVSSATNGSCTTQGAVTLSPRGFTLVGWVGAAVDGAFTLFEAEGVGTGERFSIGLTWFKNHPTGKNWITVTMLDSGNFVQFYIPFEPGFYGFVAEGSTYRLYRVVDHTTVQEFLPSMTMGDGPVWPRHARVRFACDVPNGILIYDEVSLWARPLAKDTLQAMGKAYLNAQGTSVPTNDSLPPHAISADTGDEQNTGLALHILEAAVANLELVNAYLEAERGVMYEECFLGADSPARERAMARAGRALRIVTLMEQEAAVLAAAPGASSQPWFDRYQANQTALAGKRAAVLEGVRRTSSCTNPLGITEEDLPLYHGNAVGASDRFFASSRYLAGQARAEIQAAQGELLQARGAYQQQRQSAFQVLLSAVEKAERERRLRLEYEGQLRSYCGAPPSGQKLLERFLAGSLGSAGCFYRIEDASCPAIQGRALRDLPPRCLRGKIGEQVLGIQAAEIDAQNAMNAYRRAVDQYDAQMEYCGRRQAHHEESEEILERHHNHMEKLRTERRAAETVANSLSSLGSVISGAITGDVGQVVSGFSSHIMGPIIGHLQEREQQAEEAYQEVAEARSHELDLMACYHDADNQKFAIDAARDVIARAAVDVEAARLQLANMHAEIEALVDEAAGQIAVEQAIDRTPPHHHYWLDDHIESYDRHMRYARRLTYLALRSFEYESQQTIGYRGQVLAARRPDHLLAVVEAIEQRNAPMQGVQGFVIGERAVVLSLRDEILRLEDLAANTHRLPGEPPITAEEAFRRYMRSDSSKIYATDGAYLGRGVRFSMRPAGWSETSCAERTWRITTSLQMLGSLNNARMVLLQENAFASQTCHAATRGELEVARIRPSHNLLVGDTAPGFAAPSRYTAMNVDGLVNRSRTELEVMADGRHDGFSGRGVYGNYVLLFPSEQFTPAVLATLKDVLIRFDIVEVTNVSL